MPPSSGSEPRKVPVRPASESRDRDRSGSPFKRQASLLEEAPAAAIPESSTQINADPEDTQPTKQLSQSKPQPSQPKALQLQARTHTKTPEPRFSKERINNQHLAERSPSTPGHLAPFDWEDFETRYEQALRDATEREVEHLEEFENLVKVSPVSLLLALCCLTMPQYFHVWASSASVNDNERGMKRSVSPICLFPEDRTTYVFQAPNTRTVRQTPRTPTSTEKESL